jgi:hypothetical protein
MKKNNFSLNKFISRLFSFNLLLLITFSLTISPVVATAATNNAGNLSQQYQNELIDPVQAPEAPMLIPSTVFSNGTAINIPDDGVTGTSSVIAVSGLSGPISTMTLTLNNYTTPRPQHVDFLLVGPGGQKFIVMSDAGGQNLASATSNVNIVFSDAGATQFTQTGPLTSGTFKPVDYDVSVAFPAPAPGAPYQSPSPLGSSTFGSVFGGLSGASVNGNWTLFAYDSSAGSGTSSVAGGWSLDIVTTPAALPTTTVLGSSANPSFTNQAITLTATVTSSSTVNTGVVNFVDNTTSTTLCSNVAVNGSGVATCLVPANTLTERIHQITATYVGNATFATSNNSINQSVNNPTVVSGTMFTNPGTIIVGDTGGTSTVPYPSNIFVTGLSGTISKVTVTLQSTNIPETGDVDLLLVGPGGQKYIFWSDAGGGGSPSTGTFVLDDAGATLLPAAGSITAGTYKPTDYSVEPDTFPAPAPAAPYLSAPPNGVSTFASVFGGAAPNGTWSLYATDDSGSAGITSSIAGWKLTFTLSSDAPTTTTLTSTPNPSTTSQSVLFTATVTSSSTVNAGTVTFRRGATVLCSAVPVNASGVATCNVLAGGLPAGTHIITADYNGSPGQFNISSGSTTQQVDSPTVVTCLNFANNGGITVVNAGNGNPYPSNVNVSGLGGTISKVTMTMTIGSAPTPDDLDFLLVGPGGQKFLVMGDAGGTIDVNNQTITLDDAAATALPDATAITTGTFRPASYTGADAFPAPAPAGPYNPAAPDGTGTFANVFNGTNPNGTWNLYAVEDSGDAVDTVISSWSLTFTLTAATTTTTVTTSGSPSVFGQPVTLTATVSTVGAGTPTGSVQFFDGASSLGTFALNASGVAQVTTSNLTVGTHTITAQYLGASGACTGTFNTSNGTLAGNQTVNKANTTSSVTSPTNPVGTGIPVTFTATVLPVAPGAGTRTGTVNFFRNGSPICTGVAVSAGGTATCNMTFTIATSYNITATYSGDGNFNASSAPTYVQQVVGPTAAQVSITGRVVSQETGRAVYNARVVMVDSSGQTRSALTNPFGYYRFTGVVTGAVYTFTVSAKGYPTSEGIVRTITEEITDLDIPL